MSSKDHEAAYMEAVADQYSIISAQFVDWYDNKDRTITLEAEVDSSNLLNRMLGISTPADWEIEYGCDPTYSSSLIVCKNINVRASNKAAFRYQRVGEYGLYLTYDVSGQVKSKEPGELIGEIGSATLDDGLFQADLFFNGSHNQQLPGFSEDQQSVLDRASMWSVTDRRGGYGGDDEQLLIAHTSTYLNENSFSDRDGDRGRPEINASIHHLQRHPDFPLLATMISAEINGDGFSFDKPPLYQVVQILQQHTREVDGDPERYSLDYEVLSRGTDLNPKLPEVEIMSSFLIDALIRIPLE